jgi:hypothetical protein
VAAIPIQEKEVSYELEPMPLLLQLIPSSRATTLRRINIINRKPPIRRRCNASVLYDPLNGGELPVSDFDHGHFLGIVSNIILFLSQEKVKVSGPWLFEILRVFGKLQQDRAELRQANPNLHKKLWASGWDFKIPDYDPQSRVQWDSRQQQWL